MNITPQGWLPMNSKRTLFVYQDPELGRPTKVIRPENITEEAVRELLCRIYRLDGRTLVFGKWELDDENSLVADLTIAENKSRQPVGTGAIAEA